MVFKKPYGFLIKHFKLIHLILTGLFVYLAFYVSSILNYYNDFIVGTVGSLKAIGYLDNYYIIVVVLSIVICVIVYALLRYKNKPRVLYLGLIAFVIVVAVMINMVQGGLETIYFSVLSSKSLRLYRDLLRILIVFQYISIAVVLVRGLGFDIKKFDFVKDLQELNLDISDEEEVELSFGGTHVLQRKVNRRIREFKYYYLENKAFILVIVIGLFIFGVSSFVIKKEVIDKVYEQGEQFSTNEFTFNVIDSFVTTKGYDNEVIAGDNDSFVIVRIRVASNISKRELNTANLILEANYNNYKIKSYYGDRFMDLGTTYRGQMISSASTYLFIYVVDNDDVDKKMKVVYAGDKVVNLKPVMLDDVGGESSYKLGEKIDFSNSTFGSGSLVIDSFEVGDKFSYPYQYEISGQVFNSQYSISSMQGVVLKLSISSDYPLGLDNYTFFDTYTSLKYKIDGKEYVSKAFDDKTPTKHAEGLYLAVDKNMALAEEIWFDIQIRNSKYIYKIK